MELKATFKEYADANLPLLNEVQKEMAKSLDDLPAIMDSQARKAESYHERIKSIVSDADLYLDVAKERQLRQIGPRSKEFTDLDREIKLDAAVAQERRFRNIAKGICESLETRISYSQTRLRVFSQAEGQRFQS